MGNRVTSTRKIEANRANGKAGTGPKTARGKKRSSQNARRHGLSLPAVMDPVLSSEAEGLARELAGDLASPEVLHQARAVAEAQIDLVRIRRVRFDVLARNTTSANGARNGAQEVKCTEIVIGSGSLAEKRVSAEPISSDVFGQLLKIDRYERRASSKRKFAIRRLDAAIEDAKGAKAVKMQERQNIQE